MVLAREMASEEPHGGEGHLARAQEVEDHGKTLARASDVDTRARGILGEPKGLRAIRIEGPVSGGGVHARASLERDQMGHELGGRFALIAGEVLKAREEVLIR